MSEPAVKPNEIEVTPEMIKAGADLIWMFDPASTPDRERYEIVADIYRAMRKADLSRSSA